MTWNGLGASTHEWAGLSHEEVRAVSSVPGSVLAVPVGSVEQHGPHLPVATDTILADAVTQGAIEAVCDLPLLATPPVWTGISPHHLSFGGTLTTDTMVLRRQLAGIAGAAIDTGIDAVVFVNGHGGNTSTIGTTVSSIGVDYPDVQFLAINYADLAEPFIDDVRDSDTGGMSHAGEMETALMLHLRPELVHQGSVEACYREEPYTHGKKDAFETSSLTVHRSFTEYTERGQIGDPTLASPEKGAEIFDGLVNALSDLFREIHRQRS